MNNNNGAISFRALLDTKDFEQGRFKIESQLKSLTSMADQEASKFDSIFQRTGQAVAAYLTFDAARNLVGDIVKVRGEFQQLEIAFTTMLGSKAKADELMARSVTFAATTPYGLEATASATKQLLAYGEGAETVMDTLRKLGDIASGLNIPLSDIAYLYGTTMTQGRLYAQDFNQFVGRGIPLIKELSAQFGVAESEVKGLVEAGKVGFPEIKKAIDNMTASGSMFGGLMEAQSKSIPGQIEQLKDAWDQMLNSIGKDSEGAINGAIGAMASLVENYQQVGAVLTGIIATYGTYRAAVALSSVITSTHAGILQQETAAKLAAIDANIAERTAVLTSIEAKAAEALATENQYRAEFALLAEKEAAAIASLKAATATEAEAMAKYKTAVATDSISRKYKIEVALKELSAATSAKSAAAQEVESLSRNVNTKTVILNNQSKVANTLATEVNTAANNLSAVAATRAATAAATQTVAISAMTGRQVLAAIATRAQSVAQSFLNATMLANPYVAAAAALVGLTITLWALHDGTTAEEKAQKRLNEAIEQSKKLYDETKASISGYLSVIQSDTASMYEKVQAYENLKNIAPGITNAYSMMELAAKGSGYAVKAAADQAQAVSYDSLVTELKNATDKLAELKKQAENFTPGSNINNDGVQQYDRLIKKIEEQQKLIDNLNGKLRDENRLIEEARQLEDAKAKGKQSEIAYHQNNLKKLEEQRNQLQTILLTANQTGQAFSSWQQKLDAISLQGIMNQITRTQGALNGLGVGSEAPNRTVDWLNSEIDRITKEFKSGASKLTKKQVEQQLNTLNKELKGKELNLIDFNKKPKKAEEKFLNDSIKWYEKEIQKLQDKLDRTPIVPSNMDAVKKLQNDILNLTKARTEAEKAIEIRTWQETFDEKLKMYTDYENAINLATEKDITSQSPIGQNITAPDGSIVEVANGFDFATQLSNVQLVNKAYEILMKNGVNRLQFLESEQSSLDELLKTEMSRIEGLEQEKVIIEELLATNPDNKDAIKQQEQNTKSLTKSKNELISVLGKQALVQKELNIIQGKSDPVEMVRNWVDNMKNSESTYNNIISKLEIKLDELQNQPLDIRYSTSTIEQIKILEQGISDVRKKSAEELSGYLVQLAGSEQKRAAIVLKYENLINAAREKGMETLNIERELREELAKFETEKANALRGAKDIMQAETLKEIMEDEKEIRKQINDLINKGLGNTLEVVRLQKQLKDTLGKKADTVYSNTMLWIQALGYAGQSLSSLEGVAGNIGQLFSNLSQSAQNFSQIVANTKANGGKVGASDYAAAAQSAGSLISMVIGAAQRRKAKRKQEEANTLQTQLDLNKALIEEIRLRAQLSESVYVTDYYGRIKDSIEAMQMASVKAFEVMQKLNDVGKAKNGTRNKIDWGNVGAGAGAGAAIGGVAGGGVFSWLGAAIGAVAGAVVGLFGAMKKDARYSGLFEIYPELISQSGEFNETLAKTLLANDQLDDKTKQYLQNLIDINEEWKAADKAITDIIGELTGQMGGELRDVLVQAFEDGTDAAHAFADVVEKTLQNALENLIYSAVFSDVFKELQDRLKGSLTGGASFQEQFAWFMEQYGELNSQFKEAMEAAKQAGKDVGFDLWNGSEDRANGMTGAIKGITEEQAGVLAGNITQMRIKQAEHSELFRQQIFLLANISSNTNYLPELSRLGGILRILERMESDGFARSQGWQY